MEQQGYYEEDEEDYYYYYYNSYKYDDSKPDWFTALVLLQADIIQNALSFLFSPVVFLFSLLSHSYRKAEQTIESVQSALLGAPSAAARGVAVLVRKLGFAVFGAAYVCVVLVVVLIFAVVLGVGLVRMWVNHEPVLVNEKLQFDYTEASPRAEFWFERKSHNKAIEVIGVPIGHTFSVSLIILMPESDYNRHIGVFQISAELLSTNGQVMAKSSLPCMLRFTSLPVRFARTSIMSVPLLLGLTGETQTITIDKILKHKEGNLRTEAIRVTMSPRAGTTFLPQIYGAKIVLKSKLPWHKELVRRWKWTFYVWSSLYIFVVLVIALLFFSKTIFFPFSSFLNRLSVVEDRTMLSYISDDDDCNYRETEEEEEFSKYLQKWRIRRNKRNAIYLEEEEMAGSTLTLTREESSSITMEAFEEGDDVGDSESVC